MGDETVNTIRMDREELERLLADLNTDAGVGADESQRRTRRWGVHFQNAVLTVEERRDRHTHFIVLPRNLSTGGLGVLHGGFIHPGTACLVSMRTTTGKTRTHAGTILRCQYISGRIHELGIRFHQPINPKNYLICREGQDVFNVEHVTPGDLDGTALVVMSDPEDQREVHAGLGASEIELLYARDGASGIAMLEELPDLIYVGSALDDMTTTEFLGEVQRRGEMPPTIVIGDESVVGQRQRFIDAGAMEVLVRPVGPELILRSAAEYLLLADVLAIEASLLSQRAVSSHPGEDIVEIGERLFEALLAENLDKIVGVCEEAHKIAVAHGFPVVARRAKRVSNEIAQQEKIVVAAVSLLIKACRRAGGMAADEPEKRGGHSEAA